MEFAAAGDIEVYADENLSAKLDGEYKTLTAVASPLPYSIGDDGRMRVFLPSWIESVEVRITSKENRRGQRVALIVRDGLGEERTAEEYGFDLTKNEPYSLSIENPCFS